MTTGRMMAVLASVALAGCGSTVTVVTDTGPLPSSPSRNGGWGRVIACLKNHPLFDVFDAYSASGKRPDSRTKAVVILQDLKGTTLAYVGDNALGADDLTGSGSANVDQQSGPLHYGFTSLASPSDQGAIIACVGHVPHRIAAAAPNRSITTPASSPKPPTVDPVNPTNCPVGKIPIDGGCAGKNTPLGGATTSTPLEAPPAVAGPAVCFKLPVSETNFLGSGIYFVSVKSGTVCFQRGTAVMTETGGTVGYIDPLSRGNVPSTGWYSTGLSGSEWTFTPVAFH